MSEDCRNHDYWIDAKVKVEYDWSDQDQNQTKYSYEDTGNKNNIHLSCGSTLIKSENGDVEFASTSFFVKDHHEPQVDSIKIEVLNPESSLETSKLLSSINNVMYIEECVDATSASPNTAGKKVHSLPLPQLVIKSKSTLSQDSISTPTMSTKRRWRQTTCTCPYCSAEGGNTTRGKNGKPQHICHFSNCGKIFGHAKSLYRHLKTHSDNKNFVCEYCNKGFARQDALKAHVMVHMTDKQKKGTWVKCECGNCIKGGKKADCLEKKWTHVCHYPDCEKAYTQLGNLQIHLQRHADKKKFHCDHCGKGYAGKDLLGSHMQLHMNEGRKWAKCGCPYCIAGDKIRAPDGKLQHICHMPSCGKIYSSSWQLKRHLESHSGQKNYVCSHCGKGFARQDSFDRHVKYVCKAKPKKAKAE